MRITEHVHALKIPFPGSKRFVYVYLLYNHQVHLIDSGIFSTEKEIFSYLKKTGRDPREISLLILTHSHSDHIGAAAEIQRASGCKVACHPEDRGWVEDIEAQFRERPTANFHTFVKSGVPVDRLLSDGERIDLEEGRTLKVIHTPGHSKGSLSLLFSPEGALFTGDAVPAAGGLPIYADLLGCIRSLRRLREIKGVKALFSSWHDPQLGEKAYSTMDASLVYLQEIHDRVRKIKDENRTASPQEIVARLLDELGLDEGRGNPLVVQTIQAHLAHIQHRTLLTL